MVRQLAPTPEPALEYFKSQLNSPGHFRQAKSLVLQCLSHSNGPESPGRHGLAIALPSPLETAKTRNRPQTICPPGTRRLGRLTGAPYEVQAPQAAALPPATPIALTPFLLN
jgi:hypothetical protein